MILKLKIFLTITTISVIGYLSLAIDAGIWIMPTGLYAFFGFYPVFVYSSLISSLLVIIFIYFKRTHITEIDTIVTIGVLSLITTSGFFYGVSFLMDPEAVILPYWDFWHENLNKQPVKNIENTLKCCGFFAVKEYSKDRCNASNTTSCYSTIIENYKTLIRFTGASILGLSGIGTASCYSIYKLFYG